MSMTMDTPSVGARRVMALGPLVAARKVSGFRPSWSAIMTKAYAMTAQDLPELRRVYLKYPFPHFYEYQSSVAMVSIERSEAGEKFVLGMPIKNPADLSLVEITTRIRHARTAPIEEVKEFARAKRFAYLPLVLRRMLWRLAFLFGRARARWIGTFSMSTGPWRHGEALLVRSTQSTWIFCAYGSLNQDGTAKVAMFWDHRVFDAGTADRALARLEKILTGPIADELRRGLTVAAGDGNRKPTAAAPERLDE